MDDVQSKEEERKRTNNSTSIEVVTAVNNKYVLHIDTMATIIKSIELFEEVVSQIEKKKHRTRETETHSHT